MSRTSQIPGPAPVATAAGVVLVGLAAGVALGAVGAATHPAVVAALPVLVLIAWRGVADVRVAVGIVVVSLPVGTLALPGLGLQVVDVAILGAIALVGLGQLARGRPPLGWAPPLAWAVVLLALALAATPGAVDPAVALRADLQLAAGVLLAAAVVAAARTPGAIDDLAGALVLVSAAVNVAAAVSVGAVRASFGGAVVQGRAQGIFQQPNELGMFALLTGALALAVATGARAPRTRLLGWAGAGAAGVALLASLSRGAWLGAVAAVVVLAWYLPDARRRIVVAGVVVAVGAGALAVAAPDQPQVTVVRQRIESLASGAENPRDGRREFWAEAVRQIRARPALGWGPGGYPIVAGSAPSAAAGARPAHAHNLLLTVSAEAGIPAAAATVLLGVGLAVRLRRHARRRDGAPDPVAVGAFAALVGVAAQGVVDFPIRNPILSGVTWLLVGVAVAAATTAGADAGEDQPPGPETLAPRGAQLASSSPARSQAVGEVVVPHSAGTRRARR